MDYLYWRQNRSYFQHYQGQFQPHVQLQHKLHHVPTVCYLMPMSAASEWKPQKRTKSKAQILRDQKRRQQFIENKTVCSAMPFSELSNEELTKLMPKSLCQVPSECTDCLIFESAYKFTVKEVNLLQEENKELKASISSLQCLISAEQTRLRKEERQALLSAEETEKLRKALTDEKEKTQQLEYELEREKQRCCIYQEDIQAQTKQLEQKQVENV
ncbi:MAG: hypothetical protein AB2693_17600, partial [Candidatus Thiodiazotropha sp.]